MLSVNDVAKLFCREGIVERSALDSPLLDARRSSGSASAGKAQACPLVGAAAIGSGTPDMFLWIGRIGGA